MKKNVLVFGLIAGFIVSTFMAVSVGMCSNTGEFDGSMMIGFAAMIVAFSFVFIGIKNYRDKYNHGFITFGKAFQTGLYITLIASTMYVVVWMIEYYFFIPDFMEKYSAYVINDLQESGKAQSVIDEKVLEMEKFKEMYKNPGFVVMFTYVEILPLGILITLISAFILKRKPAESVVEEV